MSKSFYKQQIHKSTKPYTSFSHAINAKTFFPTIEAFKIHANSYTLIMLSCNQCQNVFSSIESFKNIYIYIILTCNQCQNIFSTIEASKLIWILYMYNILTCNQCQNKFILTNYTNSMHNGLLSSEDLTFYYYYYYCYYYAF